MSHSACHAQLLKKEKARNADETATADNESMLANCRNAIGIE